MSSVQCYKASLLRPLRPPTPWLCQKTWPSPTFFFGNVCCVVFPIYWRFVKGDDGGSVCHGDVKKLSHKIVYQRDKKSGRF